MPITKTDGRRDSLRDVAPVATTNAGLWLDRFINRGAGDAPTRDLIVKGLDSIKPPEGYRRAFLRRQGALESCDGGFEDGVTRFWAAEVQGRMIVGIGAATVRETGISLLRTWGMPFIPGSALKGVAAAMARKHPGNEWKPESPGHRALLGDPQISGCVVFHDAWWGAGDHVETALPIDLDVMTVHHSSYYGGGDEAPCDWDEPTPVAFITARGQYLVALSGPSRWVDAAGALLAAGLTEVGVGAKTAAGYGRVTLVRKLTHVEEEQARRGKERANQAAQLRDLAARFKGASNANDVIKDLLRAKGDGADPGDVQAAAVALWRKDRKVWKEWLKKPSRSAEERELIGPHLDHHSEESP